MTVTRGRVVPGSIPGDGVTSTGPRSVRTDGHAGPPGAG